MSVRHAHEIVSSMKKSEKRSMILAIFPGYYKDIWKVYSKLPTPKKYTNFQMNFFSFVMMVATLFSKNRLSFHEAKLQFSIFLEESEKTFQEYSKRKEIIAILEAFEKAGVPWS